MFVFTQGWIGALMKIDVIGVLDFNLEHKKNQNTVVK